MNLHYIADRLITEKMYRSVVPSQNGEVTLDEITRKVSLPELDVLLPFFTRTILATNETGTQFHLVCLCDEPAQLNDLSQDLLKDTAVALENYTGIINRVKQFAMLSIVLVSDSITEQQLHEIVARFDTPSSPLIGEAHRIRFSLLRPSSGEISTSDKTLFKPDASLLRKIWKTRHRSIHEIKQRADRHGFRLPSMLAGVAAGLVTALGLRFTLGYFRIEYGPAYGGADVLGGILAIGLSVITRRIPKDSRLQSLVTVLSYAVLLQVVFFWFGGPPDLLGTLAAAFNTAIILYIGDMVARQTDR